MISKNLKMDRNIWTNEMIKEKKSYLFFIFSGWIFLWSCAGRYFNKDPFAPKKLILVKEWVVKKDGEILGRVKELEIPINGRNSSFKLVENKFGQWLGWIDSKGRVFKFTPFSNSNAPIYTGPFKKGVLKLFAKESNLKIILLSRGKDIKEER